MQDGISRFIEEHSADTDVFCFQEVYENMKVLCEKLLPDHKEIVAYKHIGIENDFPQATYSRKSLNLLSSEVVLDNQPGVGLGIYTQIQLGDQLVHVCNFHGSARPGDKLDTKERIEQSDRLIDFFKDKKGSKIIGGDFNLFPETKSLRMFGEGGYRDLIKDFKIPTTRNRLTWEMYPDNKQYYSDYVFVSPEVKVKSFSVPNLEISDHLPLLLEID